MPSNGIVERWVDAARTRSAFVRTAWLVAVFTAIGCGGSASETPPPVEPVAPRILPNVEDESAPAATQPAPAESEPEAPAPPASPPPSF